MLYLTSMWLFQVLVSDRFADGTTTTDLQQQYLLLLDERKELLQCQDTLGKEVEDVKIAKKESQELVYAIQERMRHLERELNQANTEKSLLAKKLKVRTLVFDSIVIFISMLVIQYAEMIHGDTPNQTVAKWDYLLEC